MRCNLSATPKPSIKAAGSKAAQRVLCMRLLSIRPRHTYELRQLGISHPAARIQELIEQGELISSSRITTVDGDGFLHRGVALYSLSVGVNETDEHHPALGPCSRQEQFAKVADKESP